MTSGFDSFASPPVAPCNSDSPLPAFRRWPAGNTSYACLEAIHHTLEPATVYVASLQVGLGTIESLRPPCSAVTVQIKFKPWSIGSAYCWQSDCQSDGRVKAVRSSWDQPPGGQLVSSMLRRSVAASRGIGNEHLPALRPAKQLSPRAVDKNPAAKQFACYSSLHGEIVTGRRVCTLTNGSRHAWQRHAARRQWATVTAAISAAADSSDDHGSVSGREAAPQADSSIAGAFRQSVSRLDGATYLPAAGPEAWQDQGNSSFRNLQSLFVTIS